VEIRDLFIDKLDIMRTLRYILCFLAVSFCVSCSNVIDTDLFIVVSDLQRKKCADY